jgi:hypothetical protein
MTVHAVISVSLAFAYGFFDGWQSFDGVKAGTLAFTQ